MGRYRPCSGRRGWRRRRWHRAATAATAPATATATAAPATTVAGRFVVATSRLRPLAGAEERATPRMLVPEIGGPRVERAEHSGAAPSPLQPVGDIEVPAPRTELGRQRVDAPATARLRVEEPIRIHGPVSAWLRAGDEELARPGARPGTGPAAAPGVNRRRDDALRFLELRDGHLVGHIPDEGMPQRRCR